MSNTILTEYLVPDVNKLLIKAGIEATNENTEKIINTIMSIKWSQSEHFMIGNGASAMTPLGIIQSKVTKA